jgi:hypothetical protein
MPSAAAMLGAWEHGVGEGTVERGLILLALADPGADPHALAALNIGERDRRLLTLRESCFGARMTGILSCPNCREELEIELATTALRTVGPAQNGNPTVRGDDYELRLRLPDSGDLLACVGLAAPDATRLLQRVSILSATLGGENIDADMLPPRLVAAAAERLRELDPLADLRFDFTCARCGHRWRMPFDIVPFLWQELDAWAGRTLREVHALASAYGWSEHAILSLTPTRRQHYLRILEE